MNLLMGLHIFIFGGLGMVCGTVHLTAHIIDGCRQLFNGCSLFCGTLGQSLCTVGYLVAACTYLIRDMDNISHGAVQVVPQFAHSQQNGTQLPFVVVFRLCADSEIAAGQLMKHITCIPDNSLQIMYCGAHGLGQPAHLIPGLIRNFHFKVAIAHLPGSPFQLVNYGSDGFCNICGQQDACQYGSNTNNKQHNYRLLSYVHTFVMGRGCKTVGLVDNLLHRIGNVNQQIHYLCLIELICS